MKLRRGFQTRGKSVDFLPLVAPRATVQQHGPPSVQQRREHLELEVIIDALGRVIAHAPAYCHIGDSRLRVWWDTWPRIRHIEGLRHPLLREPRERFAAFKTVSAAFKKVVARVITY